MGGLEIFASQTSVQTKFHAWMLWKKLIARMFAYTLPDDAKLNIAAAEVRGRRVDARLREVDYGRCSKNEEKNDFGNVPNEKGENNEEHRGNPLFVSSRFTPQLIVLAQPTVYGDGGSREERLTDGAWLRQTNGSVYKRTVSWTLLIEWIIAGRRANMKGQDGWAIYQFYGISWKRYLMMSR
uniref:Uncharacterized protein n=1 Tax=Steinernema glaseri TaxID=37863 RepID=A0A1I7YGK6_9BILA